MSSCLQNLNHLIPSQKHGLLERTEEQEEEVEVDDSAHQIVLVLRCFSSMVRHRKGSIAAFGTHRVLRHLRDLVGDAEAPVRQEVRSSSLLALPLLSLFVLVLFVDFVRLRSGVPLGGRDLSAFVGVVCGARRRR